MGFILRRTARRAAECGAFACLLTAAVLMAGCDTESRRATGEGQASPARETPPSRELSVEGQASTQAPASAALRERDIERLRSLPYTGGTAAPRGEPAGVVLRDPERSQPGYRLLAVPERGLAELIDEQGRLVRRWGPEPEPSEASPAREPFERWQHVELLPGGDLLVVGADRPRPGGRARLAQDELPGFVARYGTEGARLWKTKVPAHHDIELTPQGRLLVLTMHSRREPSISSNLPTRDDHLTLLDGDGRETEFRSLLDMVRTRPELFPLESVQPSRLDGPLWLDLFHANSVEWMRHEQLFGRHPLYGPENVLVCFRHQNRIAVFDWREGRLLWAWGRDELGGPHDAQVLADGHILLFDNGLGRGWSRAIEIDPLSEKIVWEYRGSPPESFYTASKGSAQRLPNGNTLLAESDEGRAIEVDRDGRVVWEYVCPHRLGDGAERAAIARMVWIAPERVAPLLAAGKGVR